MNTVLAIAGVVIKELYRRKDFYVLLVLTALMTGVMFFVNFFNDSSIVRHIKEVCLLLIWISSLVLCITTAARQIPEERENRTIFPLLAKPVTRWQVVLGKFAGCWAACGIALLVFYFFFAVVSESRGRDAGGAKPPAASGGGATQSVADAGSTAPATHDEPAGHGHDEHEEDAAPQKISPVLNYFQAMWLHWMLLGIVTAMVLFGSVVFTAPSSNTTICFIAVLGILFLGGELHKYALGLKEPSQTILSVIYFLIPHFEWYDIRERVIYDHPAVGWGACGGATLYAAAYAGVFLVLAWLTFRRKALSV